MHGYSFTNSSLMHVLRPPHSFRVILRALNALQDDFKKVCLIMI